MLKSLVFTQESSGVLHAHLSSWETFHEARANIGLEAGAPKVLSFIPFNGEDSRMRAVAEVLKMALELDAGYPVSATRSFLLEIFNAGRNSVEKK